MFLDSGAVAAENLALPWTSLRQFKLGPSPCRGDTPIANSAQPLSLILRRCLDAAEG